MIKTKTDYMIQNYWCIAIMTTVCLSLAFFGGYIFQTYQTDTYAKWMYSLESYRNLTLNQARYAEWIYVRLSFLFGSNPPHHQWFHVSLALALNGLIVLTLWSKVFKRLKLERRGLPANVAILLVIVAMRIHVFQSDTFQYDYSSTMTFLGDACAMVSALLISERKSAASYIGSCLFLILSVSFTQASIFWFVFISLLFYFLQFLEEEAGFLMWRQLAKRVSVYAVASLWVLGCFRFLVKERGGRGDTANIDLGETFSSVYQTILKLLTDSLGVMPRYFYLTLFVIGLIALAAIIIGGKQSLIMKVKASMIVAIVLIGSFVAIFPSALFDTWLAHRAVVGYVSLLPLLYLIISAVVLKDDVKVVKTGIFPAMICVLTVYILVNWFWTMEIYKGQIMTNTIDQQNAAFYYSKIKEYEENTGREIQNIAYIEDADFTWFVPDVIAPKNINDRAYDTPWGRREILPFVSGRRFNIVPFDEAIYDEYFKGMNWDIISEEQIKCIGDTAYIVLY